jgi:hypothetical protein
LVGKSKNDVRMEKEQDSEGEVGSKDSLRNNTVGMWKGGILIVAKKVKK